MRPRPLVLLCDVSGSMERYSRDPRFVAKKAEAFLTESGIATTAYFGPEVEFYIFNSARYDQNAHSGFYFIDAEEGRWNSSRQENNLGYRPRYSWRDPQLGQATGITKPEAIWEVEGGRTLSASDVTAV